MKVKNKIKLFVEGFILFNILWYILAVVVNMRVLPKPTDLYFNLNNLYKLIITNKKKRLMLKHES
jgi:NitT/TauT family transport system permease protein